MLKQIPNLFTLLNLVCGCIALICILQTGETIVMVEEGTWVPQLPEKIWWGSVFIGLAAVVDFLDGFLARLFNASSAMGAQLDSLADAVSFGVAPGMILYQLLRISFSGQENGLDVSLWALSPAMLFPLAAVWRLGRFNTDVGPKESFSGLPSPAAGLLVASLPLILLYNYMDAGTVLLNKWVLYLIAIGVSFLMISRMPFMALKFSDRSLKSSMPKIILVIGAVIAAFFLQWLAVPVVFILYVLLSLIYKKQLQ